MPESRVPLPKGVRSPYTVYLNGVKQRPGLDFHVRGDVLIFPDRLEKEGKLGFWKWFWGAWGIGFYGKDDQVDVTWEVDGRPRVAHALEFEKDENLKGP